MGRTSTTKSPAKTKTVTKTTKVESRVLRNTSRSASKDIKNEQIQIITKTKTVSVKDERKKFRKSKKVELLITTPTLRPRKESNFVWRTGKGIDEDYDYEDDSPLMESKPRKKRKNGSVERKTVKKDWLLEEWDDIYEDENTAKKGMIEEALDKIPKNKKQLEKLKDTVDDKLMLYKDRFIKEQKELTEKKSQVPEDSIPICNDVRTFDFLKLADAQKKFGGRLFDVIMMDPPWQLSTSMPSRGVAIAFESLSDEIIMKMPVGKLQESGFLFLWTINAKYAVAARILEHWGYTLVDEVTWIKKTVNGKIAKGHGYYLQHAKESCLVGVKGKITNNVKKGVGSDVIFSARRGQSQKPEEIYELIEKLVPNGFYLEIFGRRNNLRSKWVTVGNEL